MTTNILMYDVNTVPKNINELFLNECNPTLTKKSVILSSLFVFHFICFIPFHFPSFFHPLPFSTSFLLFLFITHFISFISFRFPSFFSYLFIPPYSFPFTPSFLCYSLSFLLFTLLFIVIPIFINTFLFFTFIISLLDFFSFELVFPVKNKF